jgi:hypothetical protein
VMANEDVLFEFGDLSFEVTCLEVDFDDGSVGLHAMVKVENDAVTHLIPLTSFEALYAVAHGHAELKTAREHMEDQVFEWMESRAIDAYESSRETEWEIRNDR